MALFTFFGLLGLALAAAGIYSMLSYSVARRTHEIGIRMALGANRNDVLSLMLAMGGKLVLIGLAVGLGGSLALAKLLRSEVFQVPGTDPVGVGGGGGPTQRRGPVGVLCSSAPRVKARPDGGVKARVREDVRTPRGTTARPVRSGTPLVAPTVFLPVLRQDRRCDKFKPNASLPP